MVWPFSSHCSSAKAPNGNRISEETYLPVYTDSFRGDSTPLKPNYIKDFGYIVSDDAPSEWAGKVEVVISDIDFTD